MYMGTGQHQTQTQSLAITTQAIQSIEILQFSQQELHEFLTLQAERNPLLEVITPTPAASEPGAGPDRGVRMSGPGGPALGGELPDIGETHATQITLREHLHSQCALAFRMQRQRVLSAEIVESIEPSGYLRRPLSDIAAPLGVDEAEVLDVLRVIQTFEPAGVGARNLGECLRLQLEDRDELDDRMSILLDNLPLLATHEIDRLARLCKVPRADVVGMVNKLRKLDPSPGRRFDCDPVLPALPDIVVRQDGDAFTVELNPDVLPKVLVNRDYYAEVSTHSLTDQDRRFVADCWRTANWLERHLDQRARTILKVAAEIVSQQRGFLLHGIDHLRPLDLKTVAPAVGVHESTVCRATANKYMITPRGVFELKFFFAEGLASTSGEDSFATASVRQRIRTMIDGESPAAVLSDDAIVAELERSGIGIARRTVAKYRAMMSIPSSAARRRQKRLLVAA